MPYSPAWDLSALERWFGVLVLTTVPQPQASQGSPPSGPARLRAFLLPGKPAQGERGPGDKAGAERRGGGGGGGGGGGLLQAPAGLLLPFTTAGYAETERSAAVRCVLCCAVLCCAVLCCAVLCVLRCVEPGHRGARRTR
jgi:hypothetical protein